MNEELAHCARINFENLERALPAIRNHPYYIIAKSQLDEALGRSTMEDAALNFLQGSRQKLKETEKPERGSSGN